MGKKKIIIDTDTANEVDDLFAVVRAFRSDKFDIRALNSVQWQQSHYSSPNTLEDSQRLNLALLDLMDCMHVPHPRGAEGRLYDWGQDIARHSAAAYKIISEVNLLPSGEKLIVVCLGAMTNLASALLIDPSIASKIQVEMLGLSHDDKAGVWQKRDFNCMMDIGAMNVVLDNNELDLRVLCVNDACEYQFTLEEIKDAAPSGNTLVEYLIWRWQDHIDGGRKKRVLWDLALIELMLDPESYKLKSVAVPPENGTHVVSKYIDININKIKNTFMESFSKGF